MKSGSLVQFIGQLAVLQQKEVGTAVGTGRLVEFPQTSLLVSPSVDLVFIVFVKLNQKDYKHRDGNVPCSVIREQ